MSLKVIELLALIVPELTPVSNVALQLTSLVTLRSIATVCE
jgi:hypothetical protein